jgi:hypothetical protein
MQPNELEIITGRVTKIKSFDKIDLIFIVFVQIYFDLMIVYIQANRKISASSRKRE